MKRQRRRSRRERRNGGNSRGAPYRERGGAMDSVTGTFGDEGVRFQNAFP
jgi:hypothetical protein